MQIILLLYVYVWRIMCTVEKRAYKKRPPPTKERGPHMPIRYKFDVLAALKEKGYSTYKLRKERLLAENTLQQLRNGDLVSWANIERLCHLLQCQPGDLLEYVEEAGGE